VSEGKAAGAAEAVIGRTGKPKIICTEQQVENMEGQVEMLECCGIQEFCGTYAIKSASDAKAIRRAAYTVSDIPGLGGSGYVIVTTTDGPGEQQLTKDVFLKAAGFKLLANFRNHRTGRQIHLWGAKTLQRGPEGLKDDEDDYC